MPGKGEAASGPVLKSAPDSRCSFGLRCLHAMGSICHSWQNIRTFFRQNAMEQLPSPELPSTTPAEPQRGWVWWSSDDSIARSQISVLAVLEIPAAMAQSGVGLAAALVVTASGNCGSV